MEDEEELSSRRAAMRDLAQHSRVQWPFAERAVAEELLKRLLGRCSPRLFGLLGRLSKLTHEMALHMQKQRLLDFSSLVLQKSLYIGFSFPKSELMGLIEKSTAADAPLENDDIKGWLDLHRAGTVTSAFMFPLSHGSDQLLRVEADKWIRHGESRQFIASGHTSYLATFNMGLQHGLVWRAHPDGEPWAYYRRIMNLGECIAEEFLLDYSCPVSLLRHWPKGCRNRRSYLEMHSAELVFYAPKAMARTPDSTSWQDIMQLADNGLLEPWSRPLLTLGTHGGSKWTLRCLATGVSFEDIAMAAISDPRGLYCLDELLQRSLYVWSLPQSTADASAPDADYDPTTDRTQLPAGLLDWFLVVAGSKAHAAAMMTQNNSLFDLFDTSVVCTHRPVFADQSDNPAAAYVGSVRMFIVKSSSLAQLNTNLAWENTAGNVMNRLISDEAALWVANALAQQSCARAELAELKARMFPNLEQYSWRVIPPQPRETPLVPTVMRKK